MSLSVTTAVKDKVAVMVFSSATYSALGTGYQQTLISNEAASALTHLETVAQWFSYTSGSGAAPDEWEPWFIYEIAWRMAPNACPDREAIYDKRRKTLMREAMQTYSPAAISVSPSASEAFVYNTLNNRKYVFSHAAQLSPPLFPKPHAVDAAQDEVQTFIWNKAQYTFARRPVRMIVTRTAFTGGTYTHATKTISGLTGVGTSLATGTRFYVTSGTGATLRDFVIASTTSTTVVLDTSLGSDANAQTDIAGFYYLVTFEGMQPSESFDSFASGRLIYSDASNFDQELCWVDSSTFAACRAIDGAATGQPIYFRSHNSSGTVPTILLSPPPDQNYELRCEVIVQQPADPTSTTDTTGFAKFAAEFGPTMRRLQLAKVLTNHGRHDENIYRQAMDEVESLFPSYQSAGDPPQRLGVRDVYGDVAEMSDGWMTLGGGM